MLVYLTRFRLNTRVCIDGNRGQQRRPGRGDSWEEQLPYTFSRFLAPAKLKRMEHSMKLAQNSYEKLSKLQRQQQHDGSRPQPPKEVVEACVESFSAAQQGLKAAGEESDGDKGLIALVCEHDIPIFLANAKTAGEKQYYGLALIHELFDHLPDDWIVGVLYDVGCSLDGSIRKVRPTSHLSTVVADPKLLVQLPAEVPGSAVHCTRSASCLRPSNFMPSNLSPKEV